MTEELKYVPWRLILGKHAEKNPKFSLTNPLPPQQGENKTSKETKIQDGPTESDSGSEGRQSLRPIDLEKALEFLYDREYDPKRNLEDYSKFSQTLIEDLWKMEREQRGSQFGTAIMNIPTWISQVRELFPVEAQEILTKDAIKRYDLQELITDPKVLEKTQPSYELTKLLITFKDEMKEDSLTIAKRLIADTVKELQEKIKREIITAIIGKRNRFSRSPLKISKNFDIKKTLNQNLKNYQLTQRFIVPEKLFFNSRIHKKQEWNIIIVVDQSGSMIDSVIHSSIIASSFASVSALKTSLLVFDTEVYDYSHLLNEPLEILMSVQLGGGTNIGKAMQYSMSYVQVPIRTIIVLITDFYEGNNSHNLLKSISALHESGVKLLGLTAVNYKGTPVYDKRLAEQCAERGMSILSVTPKKLADLVATIIEG